MPAVIPRNAVSRRTRRALLVAARALLEQQGFEALTMAAVAERAGGHPARGWSRRRYVAGPDRR